jgi:hypothetical protein
MFALLSLGLLSSAAAFSAAPARRADAAVSMSLQRSKALPFLIRPANVDESMPGYKGFDPLGLAKIDDLGLDVYWMREAELKHCRLAMLAVVGLLAQGAGFVVPGQSSESNQVKAFWQLLETNPGKLVSQCYFPFIDIDSSFRFVGPIYAAFLFISIAEGKWCTVHIITTYKVSHTIIK